MFRKVPRREEAGGGACSGIFVAVFVTAADSVALTRVGGVRSSIAALDWRVGATLSSVLVRLFAGFWWRTDQGF